MKRILSAVVLRIKWIMMIVLFYSMRLFPIKSNKIVFSNYYGKGYGDNCKYICEEILKSNLSMDIVWLVNDMKVSLPSQVRNVKYGSLRYIYEICTAKIWVDNCRKPIFTRKRKGQFYIQTWHGFALKKIEGDVASKLYSSYIKQGRNDSKMIDLLVSDSRFMTEVYRRAFFYNGEIREWGSPRNDIIVDTNSAIQKKVFNYYNVDYDNNIILYAPTFRASGDLSVYSLDCKRIIEAFEKRFNQKFVLFLRLHPNISSKSDQLSIVYDNAKIFDASSYDDMQELLSVSSVVISDYSSLMFDFVLSGKPCFQFATDITQYKNDRDFYFALDELPFSLAENNDELIEKILNFDGEKYSFLLKKFFNQTKIIHDGDSSRKCKDLIEKIIS